MDALTIAEIRIGGFGFNPRYTTYCAGQLLEIAQYSTVYSLVGVTYGGDARVTFGVPDLRGRFPLGARGGQGPGLPLYQLGERGGNYHQILAVSNLAEHTHTATFTSSGTTPIFADITVNAHIGKGDSNDAGGKYWATGEAKDGLNAYPVESGYSSTTNTTMASSAVEVEVSGGGSAGGYVEVEDTGSSTPFSIQNPYQGVNYVFALKGEYPARN
jgi:microcystin-dependent protein